MSDSHGKFVWYELMTTDMVAAEVFYREVVGWNAKDAGMTDMKYLMFTAGDLPVAGLMLLPDAAKAMGMPPAWIGYIHVDDVDTTAADLVSAGGVVHRPAEDIPGVGRFSIVADPHGAVFSIFKSSMTEPPPPVAMDTPAHVGWHELYAGNGAAAFAFYSDLFGWTKDQALDMGPAGIYQLFAHNGQAIGGMMTKPPEMPMPGWAFYFNVPSIDAAVERVKLSGGKVLNGPMEVPGGSWIIQCTDPQGALFALAAPAR
ncbi:VOC family protein [Rhizobium sp. BK251]|uniref:VOC family protein n=1 Tax=Rhizobium sp. BK251 TaxID=2512125 RepID=UPI0010471D9E|nr:VOC family protein [Rhizobium sp. BK251]TCL76036.1 hypothetical protein EV286_101583 [Rhizobium sp. BK251]